MKPAIVPTFARPRKLRCGPLKNAFTTTHVGNGGHVEEIATRVIYMQPSLTLSPVNERDTGSQIVMVGDYAISSDADSDFRDHCIGVVTGHDGVITGFQPVALRASILDAVGAPGIRWLAKVGVTDSTTLSDVYGYPREATPSYDELMLRLSLPEDAGEVVHELVKSHGMQLLQRGTLPRYQQHFCNQEAIQWVVRCLHALSKSTNAGIVYHPVTGWQHLGTVTPGALGQATFALVIDSCGVLYTIGDARVMPMVRPYYRRVKVGVEGGNPILCTTKHLTEEAVVWIFAKGQWVPFAKEHLPSADEILKRSYTTYVDLVVGFNKGDQV